MRQDFVEFMPSHTAVLVTNHKPQVPGDDPALWRRLRVVPFELVVPEPDATLPDRLALELPAVLAWMVAGHAGWASGGLDEPTAVTAATETYRASSDVLGRFLDERCVIGSQFHVRAGELFSDWQRWCSANGESVGRNNDFAQQVEARGFTKVNRSIGRVYLGIGLAADGWSEGK